MAAAAPGADAGQHGCLQGGLASRLEAALTSSVRGVLASTLAEGGACARAEAHVLDLCRAAERGKLCAGSSQVGYHSSAEIVAVLMHLAVQLIAFPPPRCTAEQGTQESMPDAASQGTQTEAIVTESRCVHTEVQGELERPVAIKARTESRGVQALQATPPTQDHGSQAEAVCNVCGAAAVLVQGSACSGCAAAAAAAARPVCSQCQQRVVQREGLVCAGCTTRTQNAAIQAAGPDTCDVGMQVRWLSDSRFIQTDPRICPVCVSEPVPLEDDVCPKCKDKLFCRQCQRVEVAAPGDLCALCAPGLQRRRSRSPAASGDNTLGVRIGGGYDILNFSPESKEQMFEETVRFSSPTRESPPSRYAQGAPATASDAARFGVGSYTLGHGGVQVLASSGSMMAPAIQAGAGLGQQLYRVMLPSLRPGGSRPTSAQPGGGGGRWSVEAEMPQRADTSTLARQLSSRGRALLPAGAEALVPPTAMRDGKGSLVLPPEVRERLQS